MNPKTANGTPVRDCIASDEDSHTIGTVAFGPDGSLFVSSGDGSNYINVDPRALRSQNLDSLNGKILRIDPMTGNGLPDNPFFQTRRSGEQPVEGVGPRPAQPVPVRRQPGQRRAVRRRRRLEQLGGDQHRQGRQLRLALLRGRHRRSRATTRAATRRASTSSGTGRAARPAPRAPRSTTRDSGAVRAPVYTYNHTEGQGGATSGGAFYTGTSYPAQYRGAMFIADYNDRWIRYLTFDAQGRATKSNFGTDPSFGPVQLITGPDTNIYWMRYDDNGGEVRRIRYVGAGNTPPGRRGHAPPRRSASRRSRSTSTATSPTTPTPRPLTFAWNFGDGTTSTARNPSHTYTQSGVYDARLTITEQTSPFATATTTVRITVGSNPPLVTIEQPDDGRHLPGRATPSHFSATASAGGTPMPASSMTWQLRNHHNQHVHFATLPSARRSRRPEPQPRFVRGRRPRRLRSSTRSA